MPRHFLYYLTCASNSKVLTWCHFPLQISLPCPLAIFGTTAPSVFHSEWETEKTQNLDEILGVWSQTDLDSLSFIRSVIMAQWLSPLKASVVLFVKPTSWLLVELGRLLQQIFSNMPDTWKGLVHFSSYYCIIIITDTITYAQNLSHLSLYKVACKILEDRISPFTRLYSLRTALYTIMGAH